ncbi:MAG: sulfurtransferase [Gammaproteobacteria bacterium]|nr:sulfurtransferase [Gammaproteobacteria bacterium]
MQADKLLISATELAGRIGETKLRVIDCRWSLVDPPLGRTQFNESHIPSSQYMPLELDLSDPAGVRGRHPLPDQQRFTKTLGTYGIDNECSIVAYDDGACTFACRLWWMMRWVGHADVRVLDGGLQQWLDHGFKTEVDVVQPEPCDFEAGSSLTKLCGPDDLLGDKHTLIDARSHDRFLGQNETIDHTGGHIPGAACYPFDENQSSDKRFIRNPDRFSELDPDGSIVCYCGSGVSATHNIMALLLAGYLEPILYPGSWSEWIEDPSRPIAPEDG